MAESDRTKNLQAELRAVYSETVTDHILNPRNTDCLTSYDGFARTVRPCGDVMEIRLKVKDKVITDISFWTDGCGANIAAGSMATVLVEGKSIPEALRLSQQDILSALGGLPRENEHCALQAANTVKAAARDYLLCSREPWKRVYRQTGR